MLTAPSGRRRRREAVDGRGHVALVRHGDVEAAQAEDPHGASAAGGIARRHVEGHVPPVEPELLEGGVVEPRATANVRTGWPITAASRVRPEITG